MSSPFPPGFDLGTILAFSRDVVGQPSSPSVREILAAYKTLGDGDREMLIAILNAKTAEDQRLSSVASLYRVMLEMHQKTIHIGPRDDGVQAPPPVYETGNPTSSVASALRPRAEERAPLPPLQTQVEAPRKRHRCSMSSHLTESEHTLRTGPSSPSVASSSWSDSAGSSPPSRASMAIRSLLSPSQPEPRA